MRYVLSILVLSGLLIALPNLAVSGSDKTGIHGGQVRTAGPYHLELVARDGELQLYVTDQNNRNEIQTKGGSARANISNNDNQIRVDLEPVYGNLMRGSGDFKITPETTVSVLIATSLEKDTHAVRFDSLVSQNAPAEAADSDDNHNEDIDEAESSDDDD